MELTEVKALAAKRGLKTNRMKKPEIIRAIQEAEGNAVCFDSGKSNGCGQVNCLWRGDCK